MKATRVRIGIALTLLAAATAACASFGGGGGYPVVTDPAPIVSGTMRRYQVRGRWYEPKEQANYDERGLASWYGPGFDGRPTASGERFDQNALTAAHKTLPLPGLVEVTNTANGRRIVARVNDRGPFVDGRIIDLSRGSAEALGLMGQGVGQVRVRYLGRAPRSGGGTRLDGGRAEPLREDGLRGPIPYLERAEAPASIASNATIASAPIASVAPTSAPPLPPRAAIAPAAGFWIDAGRFDDARQAQRAVGRLGGSARVERQADGFHVLVGPWPNADAAERSRRAVASRGYPAALVISSS